MAENLEMKRQASFMRDQIAQLVQAISMHEHRNHPVALPGFMNPGELHAVVSWKLFPAGS